MGGGRTNVVSPGAKSPANTRTINICFDYVYNVFYHIVLQYIFSKREKMKRKKNDGNVVELRLFHGTNEEIVDAITLAYMVKSPYCKIAPTSKKKEKKSYYYYYYYYWF
jgi:hypothetical protein